MTPAVSVVIPCFNAAGTLMAQLDRLLPQLDDARAELVLVDNNSTDDTSELLARMADRHDVVVGHATLRQGPSHARNVGVSLASSDRFLFCDADDVVSDTWVRSLVESLDTHEIATGPLDVTTINTPSMSASRGTAGARREGLRTFYGLFPIVHGGNMGVTRQAWDDIGSFDESLVAIEDMEWSLRAALAGYTVAHVPGASVSYRYRTDAGDLWRQGLRYGRNRAVVARLAHEHLGQRPSRLSGVRSWAWLTVNAGKLRHRDGRAQLAWVAGNRIGNLVGSARTRFLVL